MTQMHHYVQPNWGLVTWLILLTIDFIVYVTMLACMLVKMVVGCPWSEWLTWRLLAKQQVRARKRWESILMIFCYCMILLCYFMCLKVMIIKGKVAVSRSINLHKHLHLIICTAVCKKIVLRNESAEQNLHNLHNKETLIRQKGPFAYDNI